MDKAARQKVILIGIMILGVVYFGYNGVGAFKGVAGIRAEADKLQVERDDLAQQVQNAQAMLGNLDRIKKAGADLTPGRIGAQVTAVVFQALGRATSGAPPVKP